MTHRQGLDLFRQIIARGDKTNRYQEVTSLGGVELEAMKEKLGFFLDLGWSHFGRCRVSCGHLIVWPAR